MPENPQNKAIDVNEDVSELKTSIRASLEQLARTDPAKRETEGSGVVPQNVYQDSGFSPCGFFFCRSANAAF
jgi:hypothetical protein